MKKNFIVSIYSKIWIKKAKQLFIAEPYVNYFLKKNEKLKNYESIKVASPVRSSKEEIIFDNNFIDEKYKKYISILSNRLNKIHSLEHDIFFWKKCFGIDLIRYITLFYDLYKICEKNFVVDKFDCNIISKNSYYIPSDFNEHRDFFQCTAYGQEQIFSIYINLFYPEKFDSVDSSFNWPVFSKKNFFKSLLKRILRIDTKKIINRIFKKISNSHQPTLAIIESYFSSSNINDLTIKSRGKIREIPIKSDFTFSDNIEWGKREKISIIDDEFDRFDKFFFSSFKHCMPKIFIEDFIKVYDHHINYFNKFYKLRYVVNESWIGNNYSAIAMAILQKKGVKHIYNEHNYLSHPFLCNNQKYIFPLVDQFISLGWNLKSVPNFIKGSSLREWIDKKNYVKKHEILFISGPPSVKAPEASATYGESGAFNAINHLNFTYNFFEKLNEETIRKILYRKYPLDSLRVYNVNSSMVGYDQEHVLSKFLKKIKLFDDFKHSSKTLMKMSKLVVIDYISTSYIESLMSDTPTIFFWNKKNYYVDEKFLSFFDSLCSVGICQTDPFEAAEFVNKMKNEPEKWWRKKDTQDAKNKFLSDNFGNESILKDYLFSKSNESK